MSKSLKNIGVKPYSWWVSFLNNDKKYKQLSYNTYVILINNIVHIYYWNTAIIKINKKDEYEYNTKGYQTLTTKKKMNLLGPLNIFQKDYEWYFHNQNNCLFIFKEGMIVTLDKNILKYE